MLYRFTSFSGDTLFDRTGGEMQNKQKSYTPTRERLQLLDCPHVLQM
jgi:hypothetical protein